MNNKMSVVIVEPFKKPYAAEIGTEVEDMQRVVDGYNQAIYPFDDEAAIVCNEEGKLRRLPLNRVLRNEDGGICEVIAGTFMIVGEGEENFTSLSEEQIQTYIERFKNPEMVGMTNGKLIAVPLA